MWFFFRFITWEQRKLGEVANIQKGQQLGKAEMSNNGAFYVLNGGMEPSGYTNQYNTFANTISISEGGNSCGYVSLNLEQFWSGGHNYTLQNPKIDTFFLYQWLKRHEKGIMALRVGSGLPNIQKSALQDVIVAYPKKSEQRAIAEILNKIDNLITLHQRKQNDKFLLFEPKNYANFLANSWEQRKLGDIVDRVVRKNINLESTLPLTISAQYGLVDQVEYFNNRVASRDVSGYYLVKNGEFAYNKSYSDGYPFGAIKRLDMYKMGVLSTLYIVFAIKSNEIDSEYLIAYYETDKWHRQVAERAAEGARNHGLLNISAADFFETKLKHPFEMGEQSKIGQLFRRLDNLITLHQRKDFSMRCGYDIFLKMVNTQKMANAWEQRKLGEVGKAQSGVGFPDREQGGKTGVPFYKVSDMNNAGNEHEMCSANNYVSEAQCKKNGWMPITEISVVFAKVGAAIMLNRKRLVRISFLLDNNTMAYKFGTEWDIDFGKTLFERIDLTDLVQIGALPSYNATDVECVEISMPDKPEQHRIGVFFKQLDNLITLHQREHRQKKNPFLNENRSPFREVIANAWEQREFNSIVKRVTEMAATDGLPRVEYEDIVSGQGTLNKDIYKKQSNKVGILFDDGDVLFGKLRPYLKNWLFAAFKGIAVGDFWVLRANNADGEYIYTLLQIDTFQNIANQATGTKMPRADWSLVYKQQFFIPRTIAEQHRIGVVFKQLDNLITLHQRGLIKIQGDKNGKKRNFRRIIQRLF